MSLDAFRKALEDLEEPAYCEGSFRTPERIAIALPDGDVGSVDDKMFVDWLVEHAEPAPFGMGKETKLDKKVRDAMRLKARGKAEVAGFDPKDILDDIERALSPSEYLDAKLTDVLVYRPGGHFTRHKDTPREPSLVGTLIVGLPIAHEGGTFTVHDGIEEHEVDWSGKVQPDVVRWTAMFSDADHAIDPVTKGARVTLVYSLSLSGRRRTDPAAAKKLAKVDRLAASLAIPKSPLALACARHVITENQALVQGIEVLRGGDRQIADVLVAHGFDIKVRVCITPIDGYDNPVADDETPARLPADAIYSIARLGRPLTKKELAKIDPDCCTFAETANYDGEEMSASTFAPFIHDSLDPAQWVIRSRAAATLTYEAATFLEDGNFGNEGGAAHIYTLAVMEVTKAKPKKAAPTKKVVAQRKR